MVIKVRFEGKTQKIEVRKTYPWEILALRDRIVANISRAALNGEQLWQLGALDRGLVQ